MRYTLLLDAYEDSLLGHRNHKISKEDKLKALKKEGSDYYWY
ncbi:hypothetical protein ACTQZM_10610 [Enterococcus cecorum]